MSLARHQFSVLDGSGNFVPGAHVEVRLEVPGQPLAALYTNRAGTAGLTNPFDADSNGYAYFHVIGGPYQIRVYTGPSGTPTTEHIDRYVAIGLNSESDSLGQRSQVVIVAAGTYTMGADDPDDIIIDKTVAAPNTFALCDPALRIKPVDVIDGKGDANTNIITITVPSGKKLFGVLNGTTTIDSNGGRARFTPRQDGTGWF